jgi:hypothetical protein
MKSLELNSWLLEQTRRLIQNNIIDIELLGLTADSFGWAINQLRESSKRKDVAHSATSTRQTKSNKDLEQLCT